MDQKFTVRLLASMGPSGWPELDAREGLGPNDQFILENVTITIYGKNYEDALRRHLGYADLGVSSGYVSDVPLW